MLLCSQVEMKSVDPDVVETSTWCDCVCVSILPITVLRRMQSVGQVCRSKTKSESWKNGRVDRAFTAGDGITRHKLIAPGHLRVSMNSIQLAATRLMAARSYSIWGQNQYVEALRVIERCHAAFIN